MLIEGGASDACRLAELVYCDFINGIAFNHFKECGEKRFFGSSDSEVFFI
jgi:hypothetical protein